MKPNIKIKIFIFLLIFVLAFSNFVPFLPVAWQNSELAQNFKISKTQAAANGDGLIIYGLSGNNTPQFRLYDNAANSFGAETAAQAGAQPVIIRTKSSPAKEEFIAAYQDNTGNLRVMCYDGTVWSNEWSVAVAPSGTPTTRRFDIAYENSSGDVTVAYSRNTAAANALAYRTKSGAVGCGAANWSAATNFPSTPSITTGTIQWVKAAKDERSSSDLSAWIWAGSNRDLGAAIWSGTAFTNLNLLETNLEIISAAQDVDSFELAYESLSGDLMVVWGSGGSNGTNGAWYNTCAGGTSACAWSAKTAIPSLLDDATVLDLSADPMSDRMAFSSIGNAGSDLQAAYWSGSAWTGYANRDTSTEAPIAGSRLTQTGWLTNGATTKWFITYDDSTGTGLSWYAVTPGSAPVKQTDWTATPAINDIRGRYEVDNNPFDTSELMLMLSDSTNSIFAKRLNMDASGALTWTDADGGASLGAKFSHPQQGFSFAYRRFIPIPAGPDATGFTNNTEGALADGGRSSQQITVTGTGFGAGPSDGTNNAVKIGTYIVPNGNVTTWNSTTIIFTIPAAATVYGGTGANGLIIRAGGIDDTTPLTFYIYPNITSAPASGQIGDLITISGDHFGVAAGAITINGKTAAVGTWGEASLLNVKIPGQEGVANIAGKILLTRSDAKNSNQYPANPSNFTILAPSVSGSNPISATTGQTLTIEFSGLGIDTDIGTVPILKLTKTGQTDIIGVSYLKITDYQTVSASFDLASAVTGYWKLVIVNMDGQSGSFGNEVSSGFNIMAPAPVVSSINPDYGLNFNTVNNISIIGSNFQNGATVKLTKTGQTEITPSTPFSYSDSANLLGGAFDFTLGKTLGWWNVVVTNTDLQSGSFGNETNSGFEIRSSLPSDPANLIQSKIQGGASVAVGEGIGGQTTIWFGMDMSGGLTGRYYPQVEVQSVGTSFKCLEGVATCTPASGFFAENITDIFSYDGIMPVQGWVNINGMDGTSYHWQARVRNSAGVSTWVPFGGGGTDFYIDNTVPTITPGTDGTCTTAAINITDLAATIQWNTFDATSGAEFPPNSGTWAKAQVDYKKGVDPWSSTVLSSWENSLHQVSLSGLSPSTNYTFRMRSQDYVGNESIYEDAVNCKFTTTSTRPVKTVEYFIGQETAQNTGTQIIKNLCVNCSDAGVTKIAIPESPGTDISVKSAFIEIAGISSDGAQAVNVELRRGLNAAFTGAGTSYSIDSSGAITPFTILFNALNPSEADGNQGMSDIAIGATVPYYYTFFLKGNSTPVSAFSAKLIITYSYAQ